MIETKQASKKKVQQKNKFLDPISKVLFHPATLTDPIPPRGFVNETTPANKFDLNGAKRANKLQEGFIKNTNYTENLVS